MRSHLDRLSSQYLSWGSDLTFWSFVLSTHGDEMVDYSEDRLEGNEIFVKFTMAISPS